MLSDRDYMNVGRSWSSRAPLSFIKPIIVLNVILYLFSRFGEPGLRLQEFLLLHPFYIRRWELWRLVTYMFAHGGLMHIFFNMYGLYMFGRLVEQVLGPKRFLVLYLVSGIIGGGAWLLVNWNAPCNAAIVVGSEMGRLTAPPNILSQALTNGQINSVVQIYGGVVGASGALFGILVAAAMAFPHLPVSLIFPPITLRLRTMIAVYVIIEIFSCFNLSSNVAHLAHLGGALGGFLFMRQLRRSYGYHGSSFWDGLWLKITSLFHRRPKYHSRTGTLEMDIELMRVLNKLAAQGYDSLNAEERKLLDEEEKKLHRNDE